MACVPLADRITLTLPSCKTNWKLRAHFFYLKSFHAMDRHYEICELTLRIQGLRHIQSYLIIRHHDWPHHWLSCWHWWIVQPENRRLWHHWLCRNYNFCSKGNWEPLSFYGGIGPKGLWLSPKGPEGIIGSMLCPICTYDHIYRNNLLLSYVPFW